MSFVSQKYQKARIEFAENHLRKGSEFRKTVLLVDKGKHTVSGLDGRNCVWRKAGEGLRSKKLRPAVKHVGSGVVV
jgi:hypothetical protein